MHGHVPAGLPGRPKRGPYSHRTAASPRQLAPFDLVVLFLVAGTSISGVLGDERALTAAISALMTFGLMHRPVAWLKARFPTFGRLVDGTPVILYEKGVFQEERMRHLNIQTEDVVYAARQRGLRDRPARRQDLDHRAGLSAVVRMAPGLHRCRREAAAWT